MKRYIPVVMMVSLAVVGCNNKKSSSAPPAAPPAELTPPPAPAAETPAYTPAPQPAPAPTPAVDKTTTKVTPVKPAAEAKVVAPKPTALASSYKMYLVKKGDTLSEIAVSHKTTVKKIMTLNPEIKDADAIYVGQKLKMP